MFPGATAGRTVVVTARSLVDGAYTALDLWGGSPEIDDEQIKVMLADGTVLRAGRVWVHPSGQDLAALVLEDARPDLVGTPSDHLIFAGTVAPNDELQLRAAGHDGAALPARQLASDVTLTDLTLGAAVVAGDKVIGVFGQRGSGSTPTVIALEQLPEDLRPQ